MAETPEVSPPAPPEPPARSSLGLRLLSLLTALLALGDLVWVVVTFPADLGWFAQAWMSPAIPMFLLWALVGLPSLACAVATVRLARGVHRLGRITTIAFHLILAICTLVPLLAVVGHWAGGTGAFPWVTAGLTLLLAGLVWVLAFLIPVGTTPKPSEP